MSSSVFLCLLQCGSIRDALAALFARKGIDDEMRWADQPLFHRGGRLHGEALIHERFINTATKLTEGLGEHNVGLRRIDLILAWARAVNHASIFSETVWQNAARWH